ncbi:hypothetical protein K3758_05410 [Sulfitobacter sp. W002]|uniref:hypothetical protein n=1 Tax=Sulfitobacter sp. W002 TaxID=2867024 RepID=UPI0021A505EF|nr:hypothetical protein [Sulfitobacter sp. W002]UWR30967.1 hypothetical protein K3758_05410 [Sulfitobacter sp. W002]
MRLMMLAMAAAVAGCAKEVEEVYSPPRVTVKCPDPEARKKIGPGSNVYDIGRAHAYAIDGWTRCYDAARINAQ